MHEFLAIVATFVFGLSVTAIVAVGLEHRQLANSTVDENADVRPGIIKLTASGYAIPLLPSPPSSSWASSRAVSQTTSDGNEKGRPGCRAGPSSTEAI